jgi:hypothetical protein
MRSLELPLNFKTKVDDFSEIIDEQLERPSFGARTLLRIQLA